jgi:hypothetical protein
VLFVKLGNVWPTSSVYVTLYSYRSRHHNNRIFVSFLTKCNNSSFFTRLVNWSSPFFSSTTFQNFSSCFWYLTANNVYITTVRIYVSEQTGLVKSYAFMYTLDSFTKHKMARRKNKHLSLLFAIYYVYYLSMPPFTHHFS